jgi:hypothetical protein
MTLAFSNPDLNLLNLTEMDHRSIVLFQRRLLAPVGYGLQFADKGGGYLACPPLIGKDLENTFETDYEYHSKALGWPVTSPGSAHITHPTPMSPFWIFVNVIC